MAALLDTIYRTEQVHDEAGTPVPCFPTSVPASTGRILRRLVVEHQPAHTLEVGMAYGVSTLWIAQALQENGGGDHVAMDPGQNQGFEGIGRLNVRRAGLDGIVTFYEEPSAVVLPRLQAEGRTFDFAFIDGMHTFDHALVDFFLIDGMLTVGGHVVIDDLWLPGIRKLVSFVLRNRAYRAVRQDASDVSVREWATTSAVRLRQTPVSRDWRLKLARGNVIVLRKEADDTRPWNDHHRF